MQTPAPLHLRPRPRSAARATGQAAAAALGLVFSVYMLSIRYQAPHPERSDFAKFYASARFLWEGRSIYTPVASDALAPGAGGGDDASLHANLNPPFQTVLLAPLGLLSYATAFTLWASLSLLCGFLAVIVLYRRLGWTRPGRLLFALFPLLLSYGAWLNVMAGQFGMVLLLALTLGSPQDDARGERVAGLALGIALSLKVFVAAFVVLLAVHRRWRALAWALVAALACALLGGLGAGFGAYAEYLGVLGGVEWLADGRNASIIGLATRIAGGATTASLAPQAAWSTWVGQLLAATILATTVWFAWRAARSRTGRAAGYGAMAPAMLLASPLGWLYYFPSLVLPLFWLWRQAELCGAPRARVPLALGWLLTIVVVLKDSPLALTILPSAGLLVLWGVSLVASRWDAMEGRRSGDAQ